MCSFHLCSSLWKVRRLIDILNILWSLVVSGTSTSSSEVCHRQRHHSDHHSKDLNTCLTLGGNVALERDITLRMLARYTVICIMWLMQTDWWKSSPNPNADLNLKNKVLSRVWMRHQYEADPPPSVAEAGMSLERQQQRKQSSWKYFWSKYHWGLTGESLALG